MRYTIYLRPEPEGGYTVIVPSLPGCITAVDPDRWTANRLG